MAKKHYLFIFVTLLSVFPGTSQTVLTKDTLEHLLIESPAFTIYKDNYFITGTTVGQLPTKDNSDAKFQISIRQRLVNKPVLGFYSYLTYTQKSYWNIYKNSSPFEESNYNPSLLFVKPLYKNGNLNGTFSLSFEHESNGRDTITGSRSWNYVSADFAWSFFPDVYFSLKLWAPFGLEDNPDLIDYIGYGEFSAYWNIIENRLSADWIIRKGASAGWKGNSQFDIAYRPFKNRNQYLMLQWFNGYSENMIHYTEHVNMLRIGIVLKPTFHHLY